MQKTVLSSISQPELWRMVLMAGQKALDVALYPPLARDEMLWCRFPYEECTLRTLEDTVYGNPELLAEYKSVSCVVDYTPAVLLPPAVTAEQAAGFYNATLDEMSDEPVRLYDSAGSVTVAVRQPRDVGDFLLRTFFRIDIRSAVANRIGYFLKITAGGTAVYAPVEDGRVKIVVVTEGSLRFANDFAVRSEADAAYYILWAMKELALDFSSTPVWAGSVGRADTELHRILAQYIPRTGPLPMPSLRYRCSRSTLGAPYDLLIHPLCE